MFAPPQRSDFLLDQPLVNEITTLVSMAAAAIIEINLATVTRRIKADNSPVTAADDAAQSLITTGLMRLLPGVPVVSEEMDRSRVGIPSNSPFVLVDPLDGTREYLAGRTEFTVNVAVIIAGMPVFGCIAAPRLALVWRGSAGERAERLELQPGANARMCRHKTVIRTRAVPKDKPVIVVSRSHLDDRTEQLASRIPNAERLACGSSLKFCMIAEGRVDLYPRLAPTHEWDIAAGHAIVAAAGGGIMSPDGTPLTYGHAAKDFRVPGFVAFGDSDVRRHLSGMSQTMQDPV